jgi:hypothetical protein
MSDLAATDRTSPGHWRLMLTGLVAGVAATVIAATTMLALANYNFYSKPHVGVVTGSAVENYVGDLPSALYACAIWYVPVGVLLYPIFARWIGATGAHSNSRLVKLALLAGLVWFLIAGTFYGLLGQVMHLDPAATREDLTTAALSGVLFGVLYDLFLRFRAPA